MGVQEWPLYQEQKKIQVFNRHGKFILGVPLPDLTAKQTQNTLIEFQIDPSKHELRKTKDGRVELDIRYFKLSTDKTLTKLRLISETKVENNPKVEETANDTQ